MDMVDEELSSSNKLQIKLRFNHSKYSVSQKKFALIFVEDLWSSSQCRETSVTRGCAKRRTNQQQKHSFFLVAEVSHCIVWFPNPPTAGSQMGTLSTHCIACSTTTLKNSLKQFFLGQPLVKLGNFTIGFPIICLRPDRHSAPLIATSLPLRCRYSDLGRNCQNGNLEVTDILMSTNIQRILRDLSFFGRPTMVIGQCI